MLKEVEDTLERLLDEPYDYPLSKHVTARLLAFIEQQTLALLQLEAVGTYHPVHRDTVCCAICLSLHPDPPHAPGCALDAALTAVGLDTQEKRATALLGATAQHQRA